MSEPRQAPRTTDLGLLLLAEEEARLRAEVVEARRILTSVRGAHRPPRDRAMPFDWGVCAFLFFLIASLFCRCGWAFL